MQELNQEYVSSSEAAGILGIHPFAIHNLIRQGKVPAVKIANRWLLSRQQLEEYAQTYVPKQGRPRQKRKYTKRSPRWQNS